MPSVVKIARAKRKIIINNIIIMNIIFSFTILNSIRWSHKRVSNKNEGMSPNSQSSTRLQQTKLHFLSESE